MDTSYIQVCIAYEPGKKLAYAYNRIMESTTAEWILFLDQDLFLLCNPHWYDLCLNAIKQVGHDAGWITARCNRIGNPNQLHKPPEDNNDILYHIEIARQLYKKYGNTVEEVRRGKFSGFFILTSKSVWKRVGGFRDVGKGLSGIDIDYCQRIKNVGYKLYVIKGLYMYHLYKKIKGQVFTW